jgi:hypothetical protein
MNKALSIVFLVGGIVLLAYGVTALHSFGSDVSRFFNGSPTDKTLWLLIGGALAAVVGVFGIFNGSKA